MNQLDKTKIVEPFTGSYKPNKITITNKNLQKLQRRFAFANVLIPFLGLLVAIELAWQPGISFVAVVLLVIMYSLTMFGVEVGLHRYFSHGAFKTNTAIRVTLAILGSMAAQGPVNYWVCHHRCHHQYSDQPGDPHSPNLHQGQKFGWLRGLWHAHVGWLFESEFRNPIIYAKDLLRDPLIARVNQLYLIWVMLGLIIPTVLGGLITWSWMGALQGFLWGGLIRILLVHHVIWGINSIAHVYGSRPFDTSDRSTNNIWLMLPSLGGSLHNNHHAFPSSAIYGLEWWQIDLGSWVLRLMEKFGLVWNIKRPTVEMVLAKKIKHDS
ncbi:acyl-CoA desaturase [Moorena sp. SIOASIH]|uniref:acyl-CoA desaturase n=1 Tax=Moorena sp. SIOASIH TaxID=2607817 RepID=UPI0025D5F864|nr:acyl-CoA desaturase [Moorena sp. SIOASIH]